MSKRRGSEGTRGKGGALGPTRGGCERKKKSRAPKQRHSTHVGWHKNHAKTANLTDRQHDVHLCIVRVSSNQLQPRDSHCHNNVEDLQVDRMT